MITRLNIPEEVLDLYNLTYAEFFYLLYRATASNPLSIEKELLDKDIGKPTKKDTDKLYLTMRDNILLDNIVTNIKKEIEMQQKKVAIDPKFIPLAGKLQELYPKGNRPGCSQQWRGSKLIIAKKLTALTNLYGVTFTEEEAIDAVKRYVESFKGDYHYMECLEYFILRLRPEFKTNFVAYLENTDKGEEDFDDFMIHLR